MHNLDPNGLLLRLPGPPPRRTLEELEDYLRAKGVPNVDELMQALRDAEEEIDQKGGPVRVNWLGGLVCDQIDDIVRDKFRKAPNWDYDHKEHDGLYDHAWGIVFGADGTTITVDFWGDFENPVSIGSTHPDGWVPTVPPIGPAPPPWLLLTGPPYWFN